MLDAKKQYVRYISHEIRTPLSATFLGLKMLTEDLKSSLNKKDQERYDTIKDVNVSCSAAIDVLNDLLCYEKLESGILELHKSKENVKSLLLAGNRMFSGQSAECGVRMQLSLENADSSMGQYPILETDVVLIDKFKVDQVLRNLISNALKFSPRGSSITIQSYFLMNHTDSQAVDGSIKLKLKSTKSYRVIDSFLNWMKSRNSMILPVVGNDSNDMLVNRNEMTMNGRWVVEVIDEGAGISVENQNRLFKEIVQFNPEKLQAGGGSGFGLFIAKGIVDLHGGNISVHSEGEGCGSTFRIEIPMTRSTVDVVPHDIATSSVVIDGFSGRNVISGFDEKVDDSSPSSSEIIQNVTDSDEVGLNNYGSLNGTDNITVVSDTQKYDFLIVDDSLMNRKMLCKLLQSKGHTCSQAIDGSQAVEMVASKMKNNTLKNNYDCILMDFVMPNMDGPTATKIIRGMGYKGRIVGLTGNGLQSDINHFKEHGVDEVFIKPLNVEEFTNYMSPDIGGGTLRICG